MNKSNLANHVITSGGISILVTLFNVYSVNILSGYDKRPDYPSYPNNYPKNNDINEEEYIDYEKDLIEYNEAVDNLAFKKQLGLLVMGIICLVCAVLIENSYIKTGLGIAAVVTLLYGTGTRWNRYSDKIRLMIVTIGLIILLFLSARIYSANKTEQDFNIFDKNFLIGKLN